MTQERPVHTTGRWNFHLHMEQPLQLRISSEQDTEMQLTIEGHDISMLLDYLYEQRDSIYEATHDRDMRQREATEHASSILRRGTQRVKPTRYLYDGEVRILADQEPLASEQ
ncbi:hypothetical protein KSF_091730 [Reticulibacter mediterranei]|uniref:Uncharacterized protein n=1 Tax=Reticulibacter mediterranei TaxID=2778369 RepID=A0A8J3IV93_9CHLR|nr:hypothetical protein [Reticulibacter mediterranei]GHO99125.1 hypothetical protein KSF_091730 [Reticulibacter mediterranei]